MSCTTSTLAKMYVTLHYSKGKCGEKLNLRMWKYISAAGKEEGENVDESMEDRGRESERTVCMDERDRGSH